ncbi:hypothetical protein F4820DRAFT_447321 [Hypoxylon rubiginosum]|uniref:Uncharacterized protein n=1 Tax=Hypoxylon rubiginosum TaxID=110542 RepID=A0ACB9Z4G9_9PEZI|nr:hypothetical protein F4820DRAFT_447321 [Hypoxylon rubiginosum]
MDQLDQLDQMDDIAFMEWLGNERNWFVDERDFFTRDVVKAAYSLTKNVPMDFMSFQIFQMPPETMGTLMRQPPDIALYGKMLGINDPRVALDFLFSPGMITPMSVYVEEYLHEVPHAMPPHPPTVYAALRDLLELPEVLREKLRNLALDKCPDSSIVRSLEFALSMREYLKSDECRREFPTVVDVRDLNLVGFTYLVAMILTMVQQDDVGIYRLEDDTFDEAAVLRWEQIQLTSEREERHRGRQMDR